MTWAGGRRLLIGSIVGAVALALVAVTIIASVYQAPSCSDGKQNENEAGVDCGGPCTRLCSFQVTPPIVRFAQPISNVAGRTDVIAYIDNPNQNAGARGVSYQITLYGADHTVITQRSGTVDLAPGATVPVFVPGLFSGQATAAQAFLTLADTSSLFFSAHKSTMIPAVGSPSLAGSTNNPRIEATLSNLNTEQPLTDVHVVATVFDASGNVITASATVIPVIPASGNATALFTWNVPFARTPARVDVIPIAPSP